MAGLDDKAVDLDPKFEALIAGEFGLAAALVIVTGALEGLAETAITPRVREFAERYALIGNRALELHDPEMLASARASRAAQGADLTLIDGGKS